MIFFPICSSYAPVSGFFTFLTALGWEEKMRGKNIFIKGNRSCIKWPENFELL